MVFKKDLTQENDWQLLIQNLGKTIGKKPSDLNSVLFLIGVQELGLGVKSFTKEDKQDLIHIAICRVLSNSGYYDLQGLDEDGWPHWKLRKKLPHFDLLEQEKFLKMHVLEYFRNEYGLDS